MSDEALLALAERVERQDGSDGMSVEMRKLNADILRALGWREAERDVIDPAGNLRFQVPYYVGSLDAAMSLVPEGWKLRQMHFAAPCADDRKWHLNLYGWKTGRDAFVGRAATPALALVAASLRARAARQEGSPDV